MGQFKKQKITGLIEEVLDILDIGVHGDACERLETYVFEIIRWNRRINLTGASGEGEFVFGPLFDALTLIPVLRGGGSLVDVGSGGGLPGVPVAILRGDVRFSFVEPRERRVAFLNHVVHLLNLDAQVIPGREDSLPDHGWSAAVAEAVWPVSEWLRRAVRIVESGGAIYTLTSKPVDEKEMPDGTAIEREMKWRRPKDGQERWSARIVKR